MNLSLQSIPYLMSTGDILIRVCRKLIKIFQTKCHGVLPHCIHSLNSIFSERIPISNKMPDNGIGSQAIATIGFISVDRVGASVWRLHM